MGTMAGGRGQPDPFHWICKAAVCPWKSQSLCASAWALLGRGTATVFFPEFDSWLYQYRVFMHEEVITETKQGCSFQGCVSGEQQACLTFWAPQLPQPV